MKEIKFTPIYKGVWGHLPEQKKKEEKKINWFLVISGIIEWTIILSAVAYLSWQIFRVM